MCVFFFFQTDNANRVGVVVAEHGEPDLCPFFFFGGDKKQKKMRST